MKFSIAILLCIFIAGTCFSQTAEIKTESKGFEADTKTENDLCLAEYVKSGGNAYYCNSNGTRNPNGQSIVVWYTHNNGKRVPTKPLFKLKKIQKLLLYPDRVGGLRIEGPILFNDDLDDLDGIEGLQELLISGEFSNGALDHVSKLKNLRKLWIADTRITGSGLSKLKTLASLEMLYVDSSGLTAINFGELKVLTNLQSLVVDNAEDIETAISKVLPNTSVNDQSPANVDMGLKVKRCNEAAKQRIGKMDD